MEANEMPCPWNYGNSKKATPGLATLCALVFVLLVYKLRQVNVYVIFENATLIVVRNVEPKYIISSDDKI